MDEAGPREGLTEKVYILAGVTPLKSARMAKYMASKVAGITIPEQMIKRMEGVAKEKAAAEGIKICLETIQELREIPGLSRHPYHGDRMGREGSVRL